MAVYKFRVTFEDYDDVTRDIEVKPVQTFEDLQRALLQAINFDTVHQGSFYMSDDNWKKGQEITSSEKSLPKDNGDKKPALMKKSRLCDFIIDPHQKIYFIYDYKVQWCFYVELIKILPDDPAAVYPRVVKSVGEAPKQYGASNLGKASTEFDFFNESGIDTGEDDEEGTAAGGAAEEEEEDTDEFGEMDEFADEEHRDDH
jgi:hypothetical protein